MKKNRIFWLLTINRIFSGFVALCFEQSGYDVSIANNAEEESCLLCNFEFDVILTFVR